MARPKQRKSDAARQANLVIRRRTTGVMVDVYKRQTLQDHGIDAHVHSPDLYPGVFRHHIADLVHNGAAYLSLILI